MAELQEVWAGPCPPDDYPLIADWLKANAESLALMTRASTLPRHYLPLVCPDDDEQEYQVMSAKPPYSVSTIIGEALLARAMLRAGSGDIDAALSDLLTMRRLARLLAQQPSLMLRFDATRLESGAYKGEISLGKSRLLNAQQAKDYLASLQALPPMPILRASFDELERYTALDVAMAIHRSFLARDSSLLESDDQFVDLDHGVPFDTNEILRVLNLWFDRHVEAVSPGTTPARVDEIGRLWSELEKQTDHIYEEDPIHDQKLALLTTFYAVLAGPEAARAHLTQETGRNLTRSLMPALGSAFAEERRAKTKSHISQIFIALLLYNSHHVQYPDTLQSLCPQYLPEILSSPFTADPLEYNLEGNGYVLFFPGSSTRAWDDILIDTSGQATE